MQGPASFSHEDTMGAGKQSMPMRWSVCQRTLLVAAGSQKVDQRQAVSL